MSVIFIIIVTLSVLMIINIVFAVSLYSHLYHLNKLAKKRVCSKEVARR